MTSKYGYASEGMEYCRTSRPLSLSAARGLESARTYPIGNRVNPHASLSDNDNDKDKSRRRIAVAVRRYQCTEIVPYRSHGLTAHSVHDAENEKSNARVTSGTARVA